MFKSVLPGSRVLSQYSSFVRLSSTQAPSKAYTEILAKFRTDLKQAMVAKNDTRKSTIRSILSAIKNDEIEGNPKTEYELLRVYKGLVKQRMKSIENYKQSDRPDLAQNEIEENSIIEEYITALPIKSESDIKDEIQKLLEEKYPVGGEHVPKIGDVMKLCGELAENWGTTPKIAKALASKEYNQYFKKK
ncbi:altered inheritance of mitochondria protein 41, mitochondrial [[Candida] railenensis]|uniref:Altered inheritance of mitochondria protein 41 n=1 Tax=[Candida] railenensis TaxID=45579 RepID=A0A9P0W0H9_9ASCO|nr:altered inheritance of mitochondria protein 41, mitochondrial [[Candida] railenensis]